MATFPSNICLLVGGYGESFDPSVERIEMERGPAKEAIKNSQVLAEIKCAILYPSSTAVDSFETWYFTTIKRIGWFSVEHPRTGATISARFKGGVLGELNPVNNARRMWRREVTIEYLR